MSKNSVRKILPKGDHYSNHVPGYIEMLERGFKLKEVAKKFNVNEMTLRGRLFASGYRILKNDRPKMQLAAMSYAMGTKKIYELLPSLSSEELSNARCIFKRLYNGKKIRSNKGPITDEELAKKLDYSKIEETIEFYKNKLGKKQ